jgi:plastocyanin
METERTNKPAIVFVILIILAIIIFLIYRAKHPAVLPATTTNNGNMSTNQNENNTNNNSNNPPAVSGTKTFTDPAGTFTFDYPSQFTVASSGDNSFWMSNSTRPGTVLAIMTIPKSFEPNTNFGDARFTVGKSTDSSAVSSCLTATNGATKVGTVTINGTTFTKIAAKDAAAGNIYETTSYRTVKNNQCYAVEYTIHSGNIQNYDPSLGITAFDKAKVQNILENIVQSFKFLTASTSSTQPVTKTVSIQNFAFSPATLTVKKGTTIVWTNLDSATHTVTSDTGKFNSGNLSQNKTFSYTFNTAGAYAYHCAIHPMMIGTITVTE